MSAAATSKCYSLKFSQYYLIEAMESRRLMSAGLAGQYFDKPDFTGEIVKRTDHAVNLDFGSKAPIKGMGSHGYSIRWNGLVTPEFSEKYRFIIEADGGARLWVDGKLLVDQWTPTKRLKESGAIQLKARKVYDIRLEFSSESGDASVKLLWRSDSTGRQVIPKNRLQTYDQRFAVIGDYGEGSQEEDNVAGMIDSWNPEFILSTGDNNYTGSMDLSVGKYFHEYIRKYKGAYGDGASVNRFFPTVGNHDWDNSISAYTSFFALPGNERYYDFVRGPVHFFSISSDPHEPDGNTSSSKQGKWLKEALSQSTSQWNVVYFHHPAYSSGHGHGSAPNMQWPFKEWGADAVLSGHDHLYERLEKDGVSYFVNGLGGSHIYAFGTPLPESQVRYNADFGAMLVQTTDNVATFQFITRGNKVIDSYTLRRKPETKAKSPRNSSDASDVATLARSSSTRSENVFSRTRIDPLPVESYWDSLAFVVKDEWPDEPEIAG